MKTKHTLLSGLLAASMLAGSLAGSALPLMAAGKNDTHTVTIENPAADITYRAYQIFKGTYDSRNPATLAEIEWGDGVKVNDLLKELGLFVEEENAEQPSASDVAKQLADGTISAISFRAAAEKSLSETGTEAADNQFSLTTGYYLVQETKGTESSSFIMNVVGENMTITPKTSNTPTAEKHVHENTGTNNMLTADDKGYQDVADYNVGDTIPFVLKAGNLPTQESIKDWKEYFVVFEDTMSEGLTLDAASIKVYAATPAEGNEASLTLGEALPDTAYTLKTGEAAGDCTFMVEVPVKGVNYDGKVLVVTFNATLNVNAEHGVPDNYTDANRNELVLAYSSNPNTSDKKKTETDRTLVFTYDMKIDKHDKENAKKKLAGAQFKLYKKVGDEKHYYFIDEETKAVTFKPETDTEKGKVFITGADGQTLAITGLDQGEYWLEEVKAPDGYNRLTGPVKVVLSANKAEETPVTSENITTVHTGLSIKVGEEAGEAQNPEKGTAVLGVANAKGTRLPATGGMGTTLFYTVGGLMAAGAAVFMITRRRTEK